MNELNIDSSFSFRIASSVKTVLGVATDITGWEIKGTVILDQSDEAKDKAITGEITDAANGLFDLVISDVDKTAIFADGEDSYPYELKAHFPGGDLDGASMANGLLKLIRSRTLSNK